MKLTESTIGLTSPWRLEETVTFELFLDRHFIGSEVVQMRKKKSIFQIEYSLNFPKDFMAVLQESGVRDRDWGRVGIVAILKLDHYSFRANKCADISCRSTEAASHIWLAFKFAADKDLTPNGAEVENSLIPKPAGNAETISTALDGKFEEFKMLQDWVKDQIKKKLDPTKHFTGQTEHY
ncbi:hypothetical protein EST38_g14704, partial [Candolleomyces aberdarensis]